MISTASPPPIRSVSATQCRGYDHTIDALPLRHARFHWAKNGLGAGATADLETLPRLLEMNGHRGRSDLLLKCDIEGCEWEVLAALPPECLRHFKQIVLEIHFLERLAHPECAMLVERAIGVLTSDHSVVHVHANNYRPYSIVGGVPVPAVLELTLARAHDVRLKKQTRCSLRLWTCRVIATGPIVVWEHFVSDHLLAGKTPFGRRRAFATVPA